MKFCSKCGAEVPSGSNFCSNCGNDLKSSQETINTTSNISANVKIAHTSETTEKVFKGTSQGLSNIVKWARSLIKPILILAVLVGVVVGGVAGSGYYYSGYYLGPQYELAGVKLTDTKSEVRLNKGAPNEESESTWSYDHYSESVIVFEGDNVVEVYSDFARFKESSLDDFFSLFGFRKYNYGGDTYDEVVKRLGKPSEVVNSETIKTLYYDKFNVVFLLEKNKVVLIGIYEK